ncbi:MAG: hypothetical protein WDM89_19905 [Rhizomicrobium sp.]
MPQVNLRVDAAFECDLFTVMEKMRIASKSQAIRFAVHEIAEAFRDSERRRAEAASAGSDACR